MMALNMSQKNIELGVKMKTSIKQLAKKHLYTVKGETFWEAEGYEEFAKEIIKICAGTVDHINMTGNGSIGDLIRSKFE